MKGIKGNYKHGLWKTRMFNIWNIMISRCKCKSNMKYGGRGINVCDRWGIFMNFYEDMIDGYADNLSIDRIDNNGNYEKSNCKWSTAKEQARNRRTSRFIEYNGERKTVVEWSEILSIPQKALYSRLSKGWAISDIFTHPLRQPRPGTRQKKIKSDTCNK